MGEETKQEEQAKAEAEPEVKKEGKAEEKKLEEGPKPPSPVVLFVDLHCVGCAKKIEKSILKIRGVEDVGIDMAQNQVTIKGVVEPQAICTKIMKRAKRRAQVLSPLPPAGGEPVPEVVNSQVGELTTVELDVNMHCEACAEQLKRMILKMRGVRTATTKLSSGKVTVNGTMDPNKLVDYVYRRTKKQAKIVPQPEPEKPEEKKEKEEKPTEESKPEEKKEGEAAAEEKPPEEAKKESGGENSNGENKLEETKVEESDQSIISDEQSMQRMMHYYQPLYVIERMPPPPQLFSDENPNACCIT